MSAGELSADIVSAGQCLGHFDVRTQDTGLAILLPLRVLEMSKKVPLRLLLETVPLIHTNLKKCEIGKRKIASLSRCSACKVNTTAAAHHFAFTTLPCRARSPVPIHHCCWPTPSIMKNGKPGSASAKVLSWCHRLISCDKWPISEISSTSLEHVPGVSTPCGD